ENDCTLTSLSAVGVVMTVHHDWFLPTTSSECLTNSTNATLTPRSGQGDTPKI
ncbi:hypothetical protein J6590_107827, partial [Homalodisca vitripennis]